MGNQRINHKVPELGGRSFLPRLRPDTLLPVRVKTTPDTAGATDPSARSQLANSFHRTFTEWIGLMDTLSQPRGVRVASTEPGDAGLETLTYYCTACRCGLARPSLLTYGDMDICDNHKFVIQTLLARYTPRHLGNKPTSTGD